MGKKMFSSFNIRKAIYALLLIILFSKVQAQEAEKGDGLTARYFDSYNTFTGTPVLKRVDSMVYFNWLLDAPDPLLPIDEFSIRWSGEVKAVYSENYTFTTNSDDGVKLVVNGRVLIDKLVDQSETKWSGSIALVAGRKYEIELYYLERRSIAICQLSWSSASTPFQPIPTSQLYSEANTLPGGNPNALEETSLSTPSFQLYPIPVQDELNVKSRSSLLGTASVSVFNVWGELVDHQAPVLEEDKMKISTQHLPAGAYMLLIGDQHKMFYKK